MSSWKNYDYFIGKKYKFVCDTMTSKSETHWPITVKI